MNATGPDPRMTLVQAAIDELRAIGSPDGMTDRERTLASGIMAAVAMVNDLARSGASVQAERDQFSAMLRDFAEWSRQVQGLMTEAVEELHRRPAIIGGRSTLVARLRRAVEAVKDPEALDPGLEVDDALRAGPVLRLVRPGGEDS